MALVLPADAQVFLGRLIRLDPDAVVRLRPAATSGAGPAQPGAGRDRSAPAGAGGGPGTAGARADRTALWARLPWRVLVTREVAVITAGDVTVGAASLLAGGADLPPRRDHDWRWPLPPSMGTVVEEVPAQELREVAAAAAGTLREITETGLGGRAVGVRVVREALLDHVAIVVETGAGEPVEVPQRLVQAVVRMGFLGPGPPLSESGQGFSAPGAEPGSADSVVRVRVAGRWVGLAARYGTAWLPPTLVPLAVRPVPGPDRS